MKILSMKNNCKSSKYLYMDNDNINFLFTTHFPLDLNAINEWKEFYKKISLHINVFKNIQRQLNGYISLIISNLGLQYLCMIFDMSCFTSIYPYDIIWLKYIE